MPGEKRREHGLCVVADRLELVENCIKESKRLMVILTPASASNIKDKTPFETPETSVVGGFDCQVKVKETVLLCFQSSKSNCIFVSHSGFLIL